MADLQLSPDLRDALTHGSLALFWGGDLPSALTGLPSRQDLAQRLAARTNYHGRDSSLEAVAQALVLSQGGFVNELNRFIIRELDEQRHQPLDVHRLAAQLPIKQYIVTAYDGLLEKALADLERPYNYPVVANASLSNLDQLDGNRPTLIWLYGRVREQQSLVVTRDAHLRLVNDPVNAALLNYVRNVMRVNTLLFIGYDLSDVDFELLYTNVLTAAGPLGRRAFAVQPGLDNYQRQTWQQRNVELIDADPLAVLRSLLGQPAPVAAPLTDVMPTPAPVNPVSNPAPSALLEVKPAMPTLPNSVILNKLLRQLTTEDIDVILLSDDFRDVRASAGPSLHSLILKLIEYAEKRLKVPALLEQIYDLNPAGYLQIMGEPPPGRGQTTPVSSANNVRGGSSGGAVTRGGSSDDAPAGSSTDPGPQPVVDRSSLPTDGGSTPAPAPPSGSTPARQITYHNFELRIRRGSAAGQYEVETSSDLGGQAEASVAFDLADVDFKRLLTRFGVLRGFAEDEATRTPGPVRSSLPPAEKDLAQLGYRLQQFAFPTAVYNRVLTAQSKLGDDDSLRIRLRLDPPELAVLPWELLTDVAPGPGVAPDFWGLRQKMSLVRFPPAAKPAASVASPTPLRILLAVAGPTDQRTLNTADEIARMRTALAPLGNKIELVEMDHAQAVDLLPRLRETFHILHFIGHGTFDLATSSGQIIMEDENHKSDPLDAKSLGQLLSGSTIRLVFLNACETAQTANSTDAYGVADVLVKAGVPAAVAMQTVVRDDYAILFAQQFYRGMAQGLTLDDCVGNSRQAVWLKAGLGSFDWAIPVLTTRVSDGRLFK